MDDPTHAMNSLKRQRLDMKRNSVAKKARQAILFQFALELLRAKRENGGRLPQNKMTEVVQSMSDNGVQVGTMRARIDTIANIRQSKGRGEQNGFHGWTTEQLRAYVQYKKVDADAAMPTTVAPLRVRCLEIMGRLSPSVSPHVSDNEEEEAEQVETAVVVAEETINAPGEEQMLLSEVI